MSYEPHLKRGGELYHYRTVGSRNGYSKDPNYRPKGQKAVGKLVNGKYVYSIQPKKTSLSDRFNAARKSAGNWLSDRGRDVSKAASSARKSAGRLASKVGSSAKKAYGSAKEAITGSNAKKSYQRNTILVNNTTNYNTNRGTVVTDNIRGRKRTRAEQAKASKQQYDKSLFGRAENAAKSISKAANSAKNSAAKLAFSASKNASKVAKNAGKAINTARENAGEFLTGKKAKAGINRNRNVANKASESYWNSLTGKDKGSGNSYTKMKAADRVADTAFEKMQEYQKQYDKTLPGKAKKIASDAKYQIESLPSNAKKSISKAGKRIKDLPGDIDYAAWKAGNKVKDTAEKIKDAVADIPYKAKNAWNGNAYGSSSGKEQAKIAKDWEKYYRDNANDTPTFRKTNKDYGWEPETAENIIQRNRERANNIKKANKMAETAKSWQEGYDKSIMGRAEKALSKAGDTAKKAGESVSKFASDSFDSAKKSASEGAKRAGEFISGLTKKKEKSKSNQKATSHFELDKETGQTVYINENGEKVNKSGKNNNSTNTNNTSTKRSGNAKSYVDRIVSSSSKNSSKSSNSAKSDYERELEFNSRKNNEFGMGNASENPNFSYYTVDKETGKTVWVDKNGKKHYN